MIIGANAVVHIVYGGVGCVGFVSAFAYVKYPRMPSRLLLLTIVGFISLENLSDKHQVNLFSGICSQSINSHIGCIAQLYICTHMHRL